MAGVIAERSPGWRAESVLDQLSVGTDKPLRQQTESSPGPLAGVSGISGLWRDAFRVVFCSVCGEWREEV